ncbi:MAG: sortase domain-bontaining protein [Marmoricola sp.]
MNRRTRSTVRTTVLAAALGAALTGPLTLPHGSAASPVAGPAARPAPLPITLPGRRHPVGRPTEVVIGAIGVRERLTGVGLKADGAMATPDFGHAAWYDLGPRPGAPGPAVIVAHVHGPDGDDVFARLHELAPGDLVTVRRTDGTSTFVVDAVELAEKDALPYRRIWADTTEPVLRLITCGGDPVPGRGYPDNTIVYAHLAG